MVGDSKRGNESQANYNPKRQRTDGQFDDIFDESLSGFNDSGNGGTQSNSPLNVDFPNLPDNFMDDPFSYNTNESPLSSGANARTPQARNSSMQRSFRPAPKSSKIETPSLLSRSNTGTGAGGGNGPQEKKFDPSTLNDAIAAAGVNLQQEEELLMLQSQRRSELSKEARQAIRTVKPLAFLTDYHLAAFMNKVAKENGLLQNFLMDAEMLELVSAACEKWIAGILTKTIILSRHRRRGIPTLASKNGKKGSAGSSSSAGSGSNIQRSELSKELRNLAMRQKDLEDKRVNKRVLLGLEKLAGEGGDQGNGPDSKAGAEETLHRAANATAAMMTMNPGRKKYSWMTSNSNSLDPIKGGDDKDGKGNVSSIISVRGDNGLRFREIRTGNAVMLKDLLAAIEDERMGTNKAVIKGYAKLKD